MAEQLKNSLDNPTSTVATGIDSDDTSLVVATGHGSRFPATGTFRVKLTDQSDDTVYELVTCSARSSDTLTIARGAEGTTGTAFVTGDLVDLVLTADALSDYVDERGIAPHVKASGLYYVCNVPTPPGDGTQVLVVGTAIYAPFPVYDAITVDRISLGVSGAGGASSVIRLGIYQSGTNGKPDARLLDAGTINGTSATYQEITISQGLSARTLYWTCVVAQVGTAPTVRSNGVGAGAEFAAHAVNSVDPRGCVYTEAGVTGALPANATPAVTPANAPPTVKVRIA